jgi:hypothetical protein
MGARGGQGVVRGGGGGEERPTRKKQDEEEGHVERSDAPGKAESKWMAMAAETEGTGAFYGQNGTEDARVTGPCR